MIHNKQSYMFSYIHLYRGSGHIKTLGLDFASSSRSDPSQHHSRLLDRSYQNPQLVTYRSISTSVVVTRSGTVDERGRLSTWVFPVWWARGGGGKNNTVSFHGGTTVTKAISNFTFQFQFTEKSSVKYFGTGCICIPSNSPLSVHNKKFQKLHLTIWDVDTWWRKEHL